ncbi:MAG: hypothetical protein P1Q69_14650 [Candidatus Thorarchaeota archaeon]|nr:hypothetical protein [Candidatus Thorarchaeota archaeon]
MSEWTNTMNWRNQRKHYCSMECYAAGEYKLNRYICAIPPIILGVIILFVVSQLLMDITTVTIIAIPVLIIIWLVFSSVSLTFIVIGRNRRILKESEEGGIQ